MKSKRFFIAVLAGVLLCFGVLTALLSAEDPFFVLGGIEEGETALFDNQRYQMAGLIRHQDYQAVVMGTSLAANYRASWFTEGLGESTLKITFPDGWISEFDTALDLAFRTHPQLNTVFFCLDPNILIRSDRNRTVELPLYLYNSNPLDDVEYLLNADTYQLALHTWLERKENKTVPLDDAYLWEGSHGFSKAWALVSYPRPEVNPNPLPEDAFLEAAEENLTVLLGWAQEHPDVQFNIWFPPYSVLYWDKVTREGTRDAVLAAVEYAAGRLMECENIAVYSYLYTPGIVDQLYYYADHIHCSANVTQWVTNRLLAQEGRLTPENLSGEMDALRAFALDYDYESIFD